MRQTLFHFKAATGFGAVIDGSVTSSSSAQVAHDLMKQGLIPVRIWPEQPAEPLMDLRRFGRAVGSLVGKCRALLHV